MHLRSESATSKATRNGGSHITTQSLRIAARTSTPLETPAEPAARPRSAYPRDPPGDLVPFYLRDFVSYRYNTWGETRLICVILSLARIICAILRAAFSEDCETRDALYV